MRESAQDITTHTADTSGSTKKRTPLTNQEVSFVLEGQILPIQIKSQLEIVYTLIAYQEFESLSLRQEKTR